MDLQVLLVSLLANCEDDLDALNMLTRHMVRKQLYTNIEQRHKYTAKSALPTCKGIRDRMYVVGRDNSPISSLHPARQQPLDPTLSPPCRNHERLADWPRRQAHPIRGVQPRRLGDGDAALQVKGRR